MSGIWQASGLLVLSLALSSIASIVLAADLDRIGARTGMSEGLVGIITAFGADAPEISSAVIALIGGRHDVGLGVALGSNIFNIAGLLGLSAVVAGSISIGHEILLFNGAIAAIVVGIIAALIFGMIAPITSVIILGVVVVVYIALSALRAPGIARLGLPDAAERFLCAAITSAEVAAREDHTPPKAAFADALSVVPALVSIVLASVGMVHSALTIGHRWGISDTVIGVLILAGADPGTRLRVRSDHFHRLVAPGHDTSGSHTDVRPSWPVARRGRPRNRPLSRIRCNHHSLTTTATAEARYRDHPIHRGI